MRETMVNIPVGLNALMFAYSLIDGFRLRITAAYLYSDATVELAVAIAACLAFGAAAWSMYSLKTKLDVILFCHSHRMPTCCVKPISRRGSR